MNIWVASDCLDFCHCCHSPVTRPLCALGTLLQAEMWNCCGDGFGHFTFFAGISRSHSTNIMMNSIPTNSEKYSLPSVLFDLHFFDD